MNKPPKIDRLSQNIGSTVSPLLTDASAAPPSVNSSSGSQTEDFQARIKAEQIRIRNAILKLRTQVRNPVIMDGFLTCLSPQTSVDGRMPFTPKRVITTEDKAMLLHNLVGHAILYWGDMARFELPIEKEYPTNPYLADLEQVAEKGFLAYGAYPKDRNSAIYVLRTVAEEKDLHQKRSEANEKALMMKANIRAGGLIDGEDEKETPNAGGAPEAGRGE